MSLIEIDSIDYMFDGDLKFSGLSNLRIVFVSNSYHKNISQNFSKNKR